jgi:hypothetical protein
MLSQVPPIPDFSSNRTLFGLRTDAHLVIRYDACKKQILSVSGTNVDQTHIEPAEELAFNEK